MLILSDPVQQAEVRGACRVCYLACWQAGCREAVGRGVELWDINECPSNASSFEHRHYNVLSLAMPAIAATGAMILKNLKLQKEGLCYLPGCGMVTEHYRLLQERLRPVLRLGAPRANALRMATNVGAGTVQHTARCLGVGMPCAGRQWQK